MQIADEENKILETEITKSQNKSKNKLVTKVVSVLRNKYLIIPIALIAIGSVAYFAFASTDPYSADYVPPVPKQQLIDDITQLHDANKNFPFTPDWCGFKAQTYTVLSVGSKPGCYETPGQMNLGGSIAGIYEWVELSTRENSPTNVNAVVEFREVGLLAYRLGKWETISVSNGKQLDGPLKSIVNDYGGGYNVPGYNIGLNWSPNNNRMVGFGLGSGQFGTNYKSSIPGWPDERLKAHASIAGKSYGDGVSYCSRVGCQGSNDIKAIQGWVVARVVSREGKTYQDLINSGNTAGAQQLKDAYYVLMPGWDRFNYGNTGYAGTMGRARRVLPEWQTFTNTSMSQAQINGGLSAPPIPGYGNTSPPPPPPTNISPVINSFVSSNNNPMVGTNFNLTVNASDPDGSISKIEIKDSSSGSILKTCTNASTCTVSSNKTSAKSYTYVATVTDNASPGATATKSIAVVVSDTPQPPKTSSFVNGTYNDSNTSISFSKGWIVGTGSNTNFQGDEHYSNTPGSNATFKFTGEQLSLVSHNNWDMGQATVTIDGVAEYDTIRNSPVAEWYAPSRLDTTNWKSRKLTNTLHTAVVTLNSTKNSASKGFYISIDKIIVSDNTSTSGTTTGLNAEYFNNKTLTGTALSRIDSQINNFWQYGSPATSVPADLFSARWTGKIKVPTTGSYIFHTYSDDGIRLYVNNKLTIDNWTDHPPTYQSSTSVALNAGTEYNIKVEYYEAYGGATMELKWTGPSITDQVIPASAFTH